MGFFQALENSSKTQKIDFAVNTNRPTIPDYLLSPNSNLAYNN